MKQFFTFFAIFAFTFYDGQFLSPLLTFDAKIITSDNLERNVKVKVWGHFMDDSDFRRSSLTGKNIYLIGETGSLERHNFKYFKRIEFKDPQGELQIFERPSQDFQMLNLVQDGPKLKWYRSFIENRYNGTEAPVDLLMKPDGTYTHISGLSNKKNLKKFTLDRPDLKNQIEVCDFFGNTFNCIRDFVTAYNQSQ